VLVFLTMNRWGIWGNCVCVCVCTHVCLVGAKGGWIDVSDKSLVDT